MGAAEGVELPLAPPNWKDPGWVVGAAPNWKDGVELSALPPPEKGLLKDEPEDALLVKLKPVLAGLSLEVLAAPNEVAGFVAAGAEEPPKMLLENMGGAEPRLLPPVKAFFAGDASSCFIGLPENMEFAGALDGGDFGAPNSDLEVPCDRPLGFSLVVLPKLKVGVAAGCEVFASAGLSCEPSVAGFAAPKMLLLEVDEALPKRLLALLAGLAPKREVALVVAGVVLGAAPNNEVGLGASGVACAGFAPNRVELCGAGDAEGANGLLTAPNKLLAGFGASLGLGASTAAGCD